MRMYLVQLRIARAVFPKQVRGLVDQVALLEAGLAN
jgi:hypothetical protein